MPILRCVDCGKEIEDEGAIEDDEYVCGDCISHRELEDEWLERLEDRDG